MQTPLRLLEKLQRQHGQSEILPPGGVTPQIHANLLTSGTTGVTATVVAATNKVVVANLGDSRAVAGWFNPTTGQWRCDQLTNDHEPGNPAEAAR